MFVYFGLSREGLRASHNASPAKRRRGGKRQTTSRVGREEVHVIHATTRYAVFGAGGPNFPRSAEKRSPSGYVPRGVRRARRPFERRRRRPEAGPPRPDTVASNHRNYSEHAACSVPGAGEIIVSEYPAARWGIEYLKGTLMSRLIKAVTNNDGDWKRAIADWRIRLFPCTRPYHHRQRRALVHGRPRQF